jgi:hypothetical protein
MTFHLDKLGTVHVCCGLSAELVSKPEARAIDCPWGAFIQADSEVIRLR